MDNEIQKLSTKLEELKKRLKAINTSQNILSKLITIQDYFDQIQSYLNDLNNAFNNHVISCDEHDQLIKELQEQINSINLKLESLPNIEDYNIEQMSTDIESLKQNITDITAEISAFKGNSNSTIETIDNKLTELNKNLEELITKVNTNTSDISSLKTTTQNLSTTQTNLTATQTTLTNNINSIDKRLTKVEANISTLTGGVDVSELDNRISNLEDGETAINYYTFKYANLGYTPADNVLYTQEFFYNSNKECTLIYYDLNYISAGNGSLIINLYHNRQVVKTYNIDLSLHPNNCRIYYEYIPKHIGQTSRLKLESTSDITYENMVFGVTGKKVKMIKYWNEIFATCFNGNIYITRYYDDCVKYGKFGSIDEIDLDNLPYTILHQASKDSESYLRAYLAYKTETTSDGVFTNYTDMVVKETINDKMALIYYDDLDSHIIKSTTQITKVANTPPSCNMCVSAYATIVVDGIPYYYMPFTYSSLMKISTLYSKGEEWLAVYTSDKPTAKIGDYSFSPTYFIEIGLKDDGYFYVTYNGSSKTKIDKIAKGEFATLYIQPDESRNIYITKNNTTYKYNLVKDINTNITPTLLNTITDCDCVFELINNTILKHNISTDSWQFQTLT